MISWPRMLKTFNVTRLWVGNVNWMVVVGLNGFGSFCSADTPEEPPADRQRPSESEAS